MYWLLIASSCTISVYLDINYQVHDLVVPAKAYIMAFPLGLLDLYFSETHGVPMKVIFGASLWCSTVYVRNYFVTGIFGHRVPPLMVTDMNLWILFREFLRYFLTLPAIGILSDFIFSPMHRLAHHPVLYDGHHRTHHEYTNKLTALVLYHGALLDDFLMPFCTACGGCIYLMLLGTVGMQFEAFSNVTTYLMIFNTLLSHAHDTRCARLMAPLPDELNFVAYHYVHHLSPRNNYGLTEPSDKIWDWICGVNTIKKLEAFDWKEKKTQGLRHC